MGPIPEVDIPTARDLHGDGKTLFVDIRDPMSRERGHIPESVHLTNESFEAFLADTDRAQPVIVYCYHGNSSRMATAHLLEHGFADVKSLMGGYTGWEAAGAPSVPGTSA